MSKTLIKKISTAVRNPEKLRQYANSKIRENRLYVLPPTTIFLAVNSTCNLKCAMCDVGTHDTNSQFYQLMSGSKEELSVERVKSFIDEVVYFKPIIAITSTEPLLYKPLLEVAEYIISKGLELYITTNGLFLEKFAEKFVKVKLPVLQVSLDGPPEVHDGIRGVVGAFEKALNGISLITEYKKQYETDKPQIHINCTITNLNCNYLLDFAELMDDKGISSIIFSHINYVTEEVAEKHNRLYGNICKATSSSISSENIDPTNVDIDMLWEQINGVKNHKFKSLITFTPEISSRETLFNYYNRPEIIVAKNKCSVPWTIMQIMGNGDAAISTRCFNMRFGNIYKNTFREIWYGEKYEWFRKELKQNSLFPACTRCCGIM